APVRVGARGRPGARRLRRPRWCAVSPRRRRDPSRRRDARKQKPKPSRDRAPDWWRTVAAEFTAGCALKPPGSWAYAEGNGSVPERVYFRPGSGAPRVLISPWRTRCECGQLAGASLEEITGDMVHWMQSAVAGRDADPGAARSALGRIWWWSG